MNDAPTNEAGNEKAQDKLTTSFLNQTLSSENVSKTFWPVVITHHSSDFDFYSELTKEHSQKGFMEQLEVAPRPERRRKIYKTNTLKKKISKMEKDEGASVLKISIHELIEKIFLSQYSTEEVLEISTTEQLGLIDEIFKKKFPSLNPDLPMRNKLELFKETSLKRSEEMYKFVFKRVVKRIVRDVIKSLPLQIGEKRKAINDYTLIMYKEYFGKCAAENGESLEAYMIPKSVRHPDNPKTFNKRYVSRLKNSKEFVQRFLHEIDLQISIYEKEVKRKIKIFVLSMRNKFIKFCDYEKLSSYLKSPECKIPWTLVEAVVAFNFVKRKLA